MEDVQGATTHQQDYDLPAARMMRIQRGRGWAVYCEFGELLLTQEGDARDYVLRPGDRARINTHGRVLVEAASGARLRLMRGRGPSSPPGRPVVRVLPERPGAALDRHAGRCARLGPLSYERVFRDPRLLEQLIAEAHRERNALLAAYVSAALEGTGRGLARAGRLVLALPGRVRRAAGAGLGRLRPQLPSLQQTFAALVFLRSRL